MDLHEAFSEFVALLRADLHLFIYGSVAIVAYQILIGKINIKGIFSDSNGNISPARLQMLVATLAAASTYLSNPINISSDAQIDVSLLIGGSNLTYLVHKLRTIK